MGTDFVTSISVRPWLLFFVSLEGGAVCQQRP